MEDMIILYLSIICINVEGKFMNTYIKVIWNILSYLFIYFII